MQVSTPVVNFDSECSPVPAPFVRQVSPTRSNHSAEKRDQNDRTSSLLDLYQPPSKEKGVRHLPLGAQVVIYIIALAFAVFVLVVPSTDIGDGRRLGGGGGDGHKVITNIAYSVFSAGLVSYFVYLAQQPMLLGYLLGGVVVGPIGVGIIKDHEDIMNISGLGLVFLLFMIGLELDLRELLKMGKVVLVTGFCQFPLCAMIQIGIFSAVSATGLSFGSGKYSTLYVGLCCAISSTMIVVKTLSEKMETSTMPGRLTIGILIFQDIWAIIVLAIQPNMNNPEVTGILKTFGWIAALIAVSMTYAKFVLPGVLNRASKNNEMMLVLSLTWCFFVCCIANMPFVGLSMELASLIAGVSIATFPFSNEFNGKIKYIRDFFLTLYFVGLGMQIPTPTIDAILKAILVAGVVLLIRWVGIFSVVSVLGGELRLAAVATINLSEISEFALVICSIGVSLDHVDQETMTIFIWTFSILAVGASYLIGFNDKIYKILYPCLKMTRCKKTELESSQEDDHGHHQKRDILFLGLHRVGSTLIAHLEDTDPHVLQRCHVVDYNTDMGPNLKAKDVGFSYGDVSCEDVLEHAFHGTPSIVLSTVPDFVLQGVTNARILEISKKLWPTAKVIVTAERTKDITELYDAGASYVLVAAKLSAEYLAAMLTDGEEEGNIDLEANEVQCLMDKRKSMDQERLSMTEEVLGA